MREAWLTDSSRTPVDGGPRWGLPSVPRVRC
jgi:hypothetical protein